MKYMAKTRDDVQSMLEEVIGNDHVYFQAPPNTGMVYPCIVYRYVRTIIDHADNKPYMITGYWEIHHMYKSIKNDLKEKMIFASPYMSHTNRIVTQGVYNDYYILYQ